jgi:hypothetical protein
MKKFTIGLLVYIIIIGTIAYFAGNKNYTVKKPSNIYSK